MLWISELDDGWKTDRVAASKSPDDSKVSTSCEHINHDQVVKRIPFVRRNVTRESLALQLIECYWVGSHSGVSKLCVPLLDLKEMSKLRSALRRG